MVMVRSSPVGQENGLVRVAYPRLGLVFCQQEPQCLMHKVGRGSENTGHTLLGCSEREVNYLRLEETAWSFLILEPNNG